MPLASSLKNLPEQAMTVGMPVAAHKDTYATVPLRELYRAASEAGDPVWWVMFWWSTTLVSSLCGVCACVCVALIDRSASGQ